LLFLGVIALSGNLAWLLIGTLLIQFSANISHGALQGLIPDMVPDEQKDTASAIKAIFELFPIILVGLIINPMVANGQFSYSVVVTGVSLLVIMLITMVLVKEKPITKKPDVPLAPTMVRVLGMLAGIVIGAVIGLLIGELIGSIVNLVLGEPPGTLARVVGWLATGQKATVSMVLTPGVAVAGIVAMIVAIVTGVWAGTYIAIGNEVRKQPSFTWWVVNRLMFLSAITSILTFGAYFLMSVFNVDIKAATGMMGSLTYSAGACTLLTALPAAWLAKKYGDKRLTSLAGFVAFIGTLFLLGTIWMPATALVYGAGILLGMAGGLFYTLNWALGTRLVPAEQAGRYLGISNLAGAGAGMVGAGLGGPIADYLNAASPGLGYFVIFGGYGILFLLSIASLLGIKETG
jgi:MFS family permease